MHMNHKTILYSLDSKITFKQLQEQENCEYDNHKYTKLQERIEIHKVQAMMLSDTDVHYKIPSIRPRVQMFYYIGDIWLLNQKILGIVGPRKMSSYGKQVLEKLFSSAGAYDIVTISGLAEGVDQLCHKLSHENNIPTIAVLGWGLGRYLKRQERTMIEQIVATGGLVISEYKLWEKPTHYTFPQRNRLIAGLSDVVFLPEAGAKSGSLITVDYAIAMKKPVYATPNSIFSPTSAGILDYIENGLVKSILVLNKFLAHHFTSKNITSRPQTTITLTPQEQLLIPVLSHDQGVEIISLVQSTWLALEDVIQLLTMLEIKWVVRQDEPGKYVLG